jgi:hypothetical protein
MNETPLTASEMLLLLMTSPMLLGIFIGTILRKKFDKFVEK